MNQAIKEHQRQCKSSLENSVVKRKLNDLINQIDFIKKSNENLKAINKHEQQKAIIAEMKEVLTHIPDNKLSGYPEKLRKLAEKLTAL